MKNLYPARLFFASNETGYGEYVQETIITDKFPGFSSDFTLTEEETVSFSEVLITAFLIYLSRLGNSFPFTVGFTSPFLRETSKNLSSFFPPYIPITFSLAPRISVGDILGSVKSQIKNIHTKAYVLDVWGRYSSCYEQCPTLLPLIIGIESCPISNFGVNPCALILNLDEESLSYTLKIKSLQDDVSKSLLKNFANHIRYLFESITQHPAIIFEDILLLTSSEQHQILVEWNDTKAPYPENKTVHQLFEEQVAKTPDNIAAIYEDQELTYQQLNEKANQLAHYLRSLGVTADTLVAIAVERSLEMLIGILGILKAGGAYVPLDPDYPSERLQFMLEDTQAPVLITQSHLQAKLKEMLSSYPGEIAIIDQLEEVLEQQSTLNPLPLTLPHHLAYVIYTSGSTGKPKGVMIEHAKIAHKLFSLKNIYELNYSDSVAYYSSISADASIEEYLLPLISGSKSYIFPQVNHFDCGAFFAFLNHYQINTLNTTPSLLETLTSYNSRLKGAFPILNRLLVGGEIFTSSLLSKIQGKTEKIWNLYGPTETTIDAIYLQCSTVSNDNNIPLGRPMPNTQIYILDEYLNPVPVGVSGEIYIGGAGLARGYLKRPDLTAEKFVPNPFVNEEALKESKNLRLYRTGDLARYLPDGNIEFLGRIDDQVKIRGFRIELGEIESTLARHGDVAQAVVVAREDEPGHKQLVAYVVPQEDILSSLDKETFFTSSSNETFAMLQGETIPSVVESLRNYLIQSLPEYMIPAFFVFIDKVPLTPNGKIDRKALPAPDLSLRQVGEEYTPPQTPLEQELHAVWTEVLKIDNIGIHDNFFKLGGHSLLATQIVSRIRHIYNIDLPLRALFEHPTIHALSQDVEQLTTKNALSVIPPIVVQQRPETLPLSFAQQRLWFLDQLLSQASLYNVPSALKLDGPLNLLALEKAFNTLIERHESLRTIFPAIGGEAHQLILLDLSIQIANCLDDLSSFPEEQQQDLVKSMASQEANTPFNLSSGPLIRLKVIRLSPQEHILLVTMHHIITDGWSMNIFFEELSELYNTYLQGQEPTLSPLSLQYADFALWQRQWLQGEVLEAQLAYWKQQLSGIPDLLDLPSDKPRPKELSYKGDFYSYTLSKEIKDQLNQLSQQQGTSLFMTLLALFQTLLYRYTGQKNIVVGSPIANRHYKEIENLIGFFVNTLALKTNFEGDESFLDVLNKVKETTLQAYQHQDVPFEQLVEHLNITRTLNRNPVFQVMFFLQNAKTEREELSLQDIQISPVFTDYPIAKFDLSVGAFEHEEGIDIGFEYATDLFEEETIRRFGAHFEELIKQVLKNPSYSIHALSLLTSSEQHQILIEWNDTKAPYPENKTVHQLFEEQVAKTPDNIAAIYEDQELTYQQLNEKANQLAHYLRSLGVTADTLVAIAVERSLEMLIGILGILKAGGAYVPLDPDYPSERLQFMLEDTQAPVLITQSHLQAKLKEMLSSYPGEIAIIDQLEEVLEQQSTLNPLPLTLPHHLAYVIYTSGSTGKPKGVMIVHKSFSNFLISMKKKILFSPSEKFLTLTSFGFDIAGLELYAPLLAGASLLIDSKDLTYDLEKLKFLIDRYKPTLMQATPNLWQMLFNNQWGGKEDLKALCGGETAPPPLISKLADKTKEVWNLYGPTETTVWSSARFCIPKKNIKNIPLGRPISNTQIYILDEYLHPVPVGVSGEIYIGGAGLARGYLKRPDLTAEKFVPNPFVNEEALKESKNLRLYRTGDLARYLPDGNIEFLGRIDDQVKIRGFRIELGEIESTLARHGDVAQAVVVAREDEPGHKQLVAYVVPQEDILSSLDKETFFTSSSNETFAMLQGETIPSVVESLRNYLIQSLPEYMIPAFFVFIDKVPLTPNGKIDRKALPAPDLSLRQVGEEYTPPQTPLEQELHAVWTEVLKIDNIGIHDNFFKLGGHSLLATQIVSRIRHIYNIDLPLRALFEHPTIHALSQDVEQLTTKNALSVIPPIVVQQRPETLPLSFAQQRLWFLDQLLSQASLYNVPSALKLDGPLNLLALEKAFNTLIERHESLRTIFPAIGGEAHQLILLDLSIQIANCLDDLSSFPEEQQQDLVKSMASQEANTPFNLSSGPLIRLKVIRLSPQEHILLVTMHHIITDGWSMNIFFEELSELYNTYLQGQEPTLSPLSLQYADFALWQRQWLQGEVLEAQLAYWKQQLSGIPDLLDLPSDKPRPKELSYKGDFYSYTLSKEIKDQLNQLSQQQGTSLFMTLLALFQTLLYRYTGQKNIVVGSPIANRHYKEIENLIGFFVNTLALKTNFEGDESFLDVLNKVKETTLQAYQHQDVPFEQLVEHLNITRTLNRNPVFQVRFSLYSVLDERLISLSNLIIKNVPSSLISSKFDLSVETFEHEEGINIEFEYATDLFEEETIRRFGAHFEGLIKQVLKNPSYSIHALSLLTSSEQHQILVEWNDTKAPYPENKTVHQLFEEQVAKTPDNIAAIYEDQELTYQQLNEKANQLAHYLRSLGVTADTLVAIAVERSLEMLIGILGILKAGGAYVPLDPDYPSERLQFMLEDTQAPVLITQSHLQAKLKEMLSSYPGEIAIIDQLEEVLEQQSTLNPLPLTLPHHLAYVIYTSGSTGKPKGVMIEHKNILNYYNSIQKLITSTGPLNFLHLSTFAADLGNTSLYSSILQGHALHILGDKSVLDPKVFLNYVVHNNINFIKITPSHFEFFLSSLDSYKFNDLYLFVGGEVLNTSSVLNKENVKIFNHYGPTEITVGCSVFKIDELEQISQLSIPLGRPISNTQIYILDEYLNPVPVGVSGEIYIGGAGLARGYLKRPDLTAEKFVPNPFVNEEALKESKNLRLYRTGDLARYLPDGNIEFLGRIDDQVKIRGFRIELGEIESTLARHGDVAQAVVVAREDEPGHKQLVAYVVPGDFTPMVEELREFLASKLPEYMIPAFFVFIDKVPLTPNGKIDRKALPAPDLSLRQTAEEYTPPQTPLEQELHAVWSEVLKIDNIGIHDNFFKLGGDSIISIQLVAKARQRGIYLAVKDIFTHPTIAALASIDQTQQNLLTLKPDQNLVQGSIALTPIQWWFFEQEFANKDHYNQATLLQLDKQVDPSLLHQAFEILINHHDVLRCRYIQELTKLWKQENLKNEDGTSIWISLDFTQLSDEELSFQIEQEAELLQQSLNIERGPLIKVALFDCGQERPARLLIIIHHLVIDGVSWRILLEDLEDVYDALKDGKTPSLPPKTHSYQQWGQALISYAQSEEIKKEISYWQTISRSIQPLPIEFDKGPHTRSHTHTLTANLTKEETTALLQKVPKAYRTQINDILLTALTLAIGDWTQDYSLSLVLEGHGREDIIPGIDLSRTVGWFTSIFPVCLKINNPDDLGDSIKTVKETLRQIPHKGIGYGILKYLAKEDELSSSSLQPSLSFNYLGQWDNTLSQGGLFEFGQESAGNSISLDNAMPCSLNINCEIREGIFQVFWSYSTHHYQTHTMEAVIHSYTNRLQQLIHHCSQDHNFGYTPSDFNLAKNKEKIQKRISLILGDKYAKQ